MIAGLPTEHYRLTLDYDITLAFGNIPLTQTVHEVIDKWVTQAFGNVAEAFLATGTIRTGNPDLDDLIATENTKIKGFALKQTTSVATTTRRTDVPGSKLSDVFRPTRTQIRELTITSESDDVQLLISVSDTGPGLPAEHADQIFNAFFTTKDHGIGMGLPISRSIVESHGGRLRVTDTGARGATFQLSLPVATATRDR